LGKAGGGEQTSKKSRRNFFSSAQAVSAAFPAASQGAIRLRKLKLPFHFSRFVSTMATNSIQSNDWGEGEKFKKWCRSFFHSSDVEEHFFECLYNLGLAIHMHDAEQARKLFREIDLLRAVDLDVCECLLQYGARNNISFVKFIVDERDTSKFELLTRSYYRNDHGENVLHVAMQNKRNDVVKYLLEDWVRLPVRALQALRTSNL
jgi:hypothetical protein